MDAKAIRKHEGGLSLWRRKKARVLLFLVFGALSGANEFNTTRHDADKFYSFPLVMRSFEIYW